MILPEKPWATDPRTGGGGRARGAWGPTRSHASPWEPLHKVEAGRFRRSCGAVEPFVLVGTECFCLWGPRCLTSATESTKMARCGYNLIAIWRGRRSESLSQTTNSKQQTTNSKLQTTNNKQQTRNNKHQTTNNKQQTTNNKQQTINNQQPMHNTHLPGQSANAAAGIGLMLDLA